MLAGLTHPGLVAVYDAGDEDGALFMVLELIEGPTLAARLADGPMADEAVRGVGGELAAALAYVHAQGIVHRDIKPSNVFFDGTGRARLGDFGIARLDDTTALTKTDTTIGTAAYMAPEQIEGRSATDRSDVYALGLVLLECLTGSHPFPARPRPPPSPRLSHNRGARRPARAMAGAAPGDDRSRTIPPAGRTTVARDLDAEPPALAGAATEPLAVTATKTMPAPEPRPAPAAAAPGSGRRRAILAVAAALVILLLVAAGLAARDNDPPAADTEAVAPTSTAPPTTVPATTVAPTTVAPTTTPPPTTVPPTTAAPAVDCAALEAEKEALEEEKRQIKDQYRDNRETRDQLLDELEDRKHQIDEQLRESC